MASVGAWHERFGRTAPVGVEIGFGTGHALAHWADTAAHLNLIGIDVYEPGIGRLMLELTRQGLTNVRVLQAEASVAFATAFAPASMEEVRVYFPDPWPKRRHHKRRLIQPEFIALVSDRLTDGGILRIATDWEPYALWIRACCDAEPELAGGLAPGRADRPQTRFERRGLAAGRSVWEFEYTRRARKPL